MACSLTFISQAPAVQWSQSLADTARIIAESCEYRHNTSVNGGGYGQNIGAGFSPNAMGFLITEGFYNSEVNHYTAYGKEPNTTEVGLWGHFSQIVVSNPLCRLWTIRTTAGGRPCHLQDVKRGTPIDPRRLLTLYVVVEFYHVRRLLHAGLFRDGPEEYWWRNIALVFGLQLRPSW